MMSTKNGTYKAKNKLIAKWLNNENKTIATANNANIYV